MIQNISTVLTKLAVALNLLSIALASGIPTSTINVAPSTDLSDSRAFVANEAVKYGINPALATCLVQYESQWQGDRIGDVGNKNGESYGWWQIELQQHPDVTQAVAFSITSSTDWALEKINEGHVSWWTTYKDFCSMYPIR